MDGATIAQWTATGIIAIGLYLTYRNNGRKQKEAEGRRIERWAVLETELANVKKELSDPNHGLGKIKESVDEQLRHCAQVVSGFEERIKNIEERLRGG